MTSRLHEALGTFQRLMDELLPAPRGPQSCTRQRRPRKRSRTSSKQWAAILCYAALTFRKQTDLWDWVLGQFSRTPEAHQLIFTKPSVLLYSREQFCWEDVYPVNRRQISVVHGRAALSVGGPPCSRRQYSRPLGGLCVMVTPSVFFFRIIFNVAHVKC